MPEREIDVLVRCFRLESLVNDLVASGEWKIMDDRIPDYTTPKIVWLESYLESPFMEYIRLWPEEIYKLSIDCNKIEVPDIWIMQPVLLEEEYYRDPYERFGPPRLSTRTGAILPRQQVRAKVMQQEIPIFIPTIEDHLNAYLDQRREELDTGVLNEGYPEWQIRNFIRFLYLGWALTREWLMTFKIRERNRKLMTERLNKFRRKLLILYDQVLERNVFDKMPWDLSIRPDLQIEKEA